MESYWDVYLYRNDSEEYLGRATWGGGDFVGFSWTVTGPPSDYCQIAVVARWAGSSYQFWEESGIFSITGSGGAGKTIHVVAPNGGENWPIGSSQTTTWITSGSVAYVDIWISRDGGANWKMVLEECAKQDRRVWVKCNCW